MYFFVVITKVVYAAVQKIGVTKNEAPQEERIRKATNILAKVIAQRGSELSLIPQWKSAYNAKLY